MKFLILLAGFLASGHALADETTLKFYGYAFDLKSNVYLYTEAHHQRVDGERWLGGDIEYYDADGKSIGHKTLDFSKDEFVPLYRLDLTALGYFEAITGIHDGKIDMERCTGAGKPVEKDSIDYRAPLAADSGFHNLVRANFPALLAGEKVKFRLGVAGSLDSFKFVAKRIEDGTFEGKPAVRFRVAPDSLLSLIADPLELTYEAATRRLLEFRGISNIHAAGTRKPYIARIAYYSAPPPEAKNLPPLP
jgi:hypothetical protein